MNSSDSDESTMFDSDDSAGTSTSTSDGSTQEMGSGIELGSSLETRSDRATRVGLFSWKKRRLSFSLSRRKVEPFVEKTDAKMDKSDSTQVHRTPDREIPAHVNRSCLFIRLFYILRYSCITC